MNKSARYSPQVRERAVLLVCEHQGEYRSQWAALESIAPSTYYEHKAREADPQRLPPRV
jgi:transposase-like protein